MKKLQKLFFAFCILLNNINNMFGMDNPSTTSVLDKQKPIEVSVYKRGKNSQDSFFSITDKKNAKIFDNNEKHGYCAVKFIEEKCFFQQINYTNKA